MNKIELLAPAGNWDALVAAINAGADAIYLGGQSFGARHFANNFSQEELMKALDFAHLHQVKIYITVNTLIDNNELTNLEDYLYFLYQSGVDAIIVQDVSILSIAQKIVPNLPIHISTQMSIMNSSGVNFLEKYNVKRVVLARECSLTEIKKITTQTNTEIEIFAHGALCIGYSGQCLMSSLIGGRSGNRGKCAQPCRMPYTLVDEDNNPLFNNEQAGKYLLSPRDLKTLEILPELISSGVHSLKIEGRMKRAEYVGIVTNAYRRAIDSYYENDFHIGAEDNKNITQVFNRDFTTAHLLGKPNENLMSDRRPNNRGVQIGRVLSYDRGSRLVEVKLEEDLSVGDGLEFWVSVGGRVATTVEYLDRDGEEVFSANKGDIVHFPIPSEVRISDRVFRNLDKNLMEYAGNFYGEKNYRKLPVSAHVEARVDQTMKISFTDEDSNVGYAETDFVGQVAIKRPLSEESILKQIDRLGTTPFLLKNLVCELDENVMFPISEINEARRQAAENLLQNKIHSFAPTRKAPTLDKKNRVNLNIITRTQKTPQLIVHVDSYSKAETAWAASTDLVMLGGESFAHQKVSLRDYEKFIAVSQQKNIPAIIATPRIIKESNLSLVREELEAICYLQPQVISINNVALWDIGKKHLDAGNVKELWADWGLNCYNSVATKFWQSNSATAVHLSPELNFTQIEEIAQTTELKLACVIHGNLEMMVSDYCILGTFANKNKTTCSAPCQNQKIYLQDRLEEKFPVVTDQFCRTHILNAKELNMLGYLDKFKDLGINYLIIDARFMTTNKITSVVSSYKKALQGNLVANELDNRFTKGHYFRGVL